MTEGPSEELLRQTGRFLLDETAGQRRKLRLLRRLLRFPQDPRVREVLLKAAIVEKNDGVLASLLLALGKARDPELADRLVIFLGHPSAKVVAAALKAIGQCDARAGPARILPFLSSRTPRVRTAAVLALLTISPREAESAIQSLAASSLPDVRRSAVRCLTVCPPAMVVVLGLSMLRREQDPGLATELAMVLGRCSDEDGMRQIIGARRELALADAEGADRIAEYLDTAVRQAAERLQTSAADLPAMLGLPAAGDRQASQGPTTAAAGFAHGSRGAGRGDGKAQGLSPMFDQEGGAAPAAGVVLAAKVLLLAGIAGGGALLMRLGLRATHIARQPPPIHAVASVPARTALGAVGETVLIEGKVLRRFERQRAVVVQLDAGALVWLRFLEAIPQGMMPGERVALMGCIETAASQGAIYVRAVSPSGERGGR